MSSWRINPSGVQQILRVVGEDGQDLHQALSEEKFQSIFEGLTWGGSLTQVVPEAVSAVLADQEANLTNIANRINAGVVGVSNAVIAYNHGQEEMASSYHRELLESAESGDFSYFAEHGYQG